MSPERKRKILAELVPADTPRATLIEARFLDNTTRYFGVDKPFVVTLRHLVFNEPPSKINDHRSEGWGVSLKSIDRYTGGGGVYDTLEEARKVFDSHITGTGHEPALF